MTLTDKSQFVVRDKYRGKSFQLLSATCDPIGRVNHRKDIMIASWGSGEHGALGHGKGVSECLLPRYFCILVQGLSIILSSLRE